MEKTILKLYENGDVESFVPINYGSGISFSENSITIPQIIEYPPSGYRNYFIEKTSESGYIAVENGFVYIGDEYERSTDFIQKANGETLTVRIRYENLQIGDSRAWMTCHYYNSQKQFLSTSLDTYIVDENATGSQAYQTTMSPPNNTAFVRFGFNLYDHPRVNVKISIEKKSTATTKHYLAFEDMPEWVVDTGNPVSILPEGIVIKGNAITPLIETDLIFSDNFNRSNAETLGNNWEITSGSFAIENNLAMPTNLNSTNNTAIVDVGTQDNISIELGVISPNISEGIMIRFVDNANYIQVLCEIGEYCIRVRENNYSYNLEWSEFGAVTEPHRARVELRGAEIKVFVDDKLIITSGSPLFLDSTKCGIKAWSNNGSIGYFDDFEVRKLPE